MSDISFTGLGSGIDTASMIDALMSVEKRPIQRLETKQNLVLQKKQAFQSFNTLISGLQTSSQRLAKSETFQTFQASMEPNKTLGASIDRGASAGSYTIEVLQTATAEQLSSSAFSDRLDQLNLSGNLLINGVGIEIKAEDSLLDINNKINKSQSGVSASVVSVSSDDHRLLITSSKTGAAGINLIEAGSENLLNQLGFTNGTISSKHAISGGLESDTFASRTSFISNNLNLNGIQSGTVQIGSASLNLNLATQSLSDISEAINTTNIAGVTASVQEVEVDGQTTYKLQINGTQTLVDDNNVLQKLGLLEANKDPSRVLQTGQDSQFRVNNIDITRSSNTVSDVINGVTLNLKSPNASTEEAPVQLRIEENVDLVKSSVSDFVEKYNTVRGFISAQFTYDAETQASGLLFGDSSLRSVQTQIQRVLSGVISGLEGDFDTLVSIGITTDRAGLLTVDTTKLNQALEADVDQVAEIFLGKGRSTDNNIRFVNFTEETKAGSYNVNLTAAAEQATVSGSGIINSSSGINADEILTFTDLGSNRTAEVLLSAGDQIDEIVSKINSELRSRISEVHTSDVGNVATSGSVITRDTTFGDIAGANVQTGDTIKINGTSHDGRSVSTTYTITATNTIDDFLSTIENLHNNEVSVAIDSAGKLVVTDQVAGDSDLAISIEARNEGNGSLGFGTLTASTVGRSQLYVNASNDGGQLKLTHENYGTDYGFRVLSNRSIGGSTGIGTISVEDFGVDVAGTIDGETATGDGRYLTGDEGNTNTGGLRVQASLTVAELTTQGAAQGAIRTTFGFAEQIDRLMDSFLDSVNGSLTRRVKSFTNEDKSIQSQIDRIELRLEQVEFRYKNMFLAMERAISQFNSQGSFLSNQLSIMNNSQWGQNR